MMKGFVLTMFCVIVLSACGGYQKPTSGTKIVAFGDSLTAGYGLSEEEGYVSQLSVVLERDIINAGVSGDTTTEARERLQVDVLDEDPRLVILLLGGNDALQNVSPDITFTNLDHIIDEIQGVGAGVVLVGVRGGLHNGTYKKRFKELAEEKNIPYVPDALRDLFGNRDLMYDTIHPNREVTQFLHREFYRLSLKCLNRCIDS